MFPCGDVWGIGAAGAPGERPERIPPCRTSAILPSGVVTKYRIVPEGAPVFPCGDVCGIVNARQVYLPAPPRPSFRQASSHNTASHRKVLPFSLAGMSAASAQLGLLVNDRKVYLPAVPQPSFRQASPHSTGSCRKVLPCSLEEMSAASVQLGLLVYTSLQYLDHPSVRRRHIIRDRVGRCSHFPLRGCRGHWCNWSVQSVCGKAGVCAASVLASCTGDTFILLETSLDAARPGNTGLLKGSGPQSKERL